ncbi:hypothetical protein HDV03_003003 [Kappamyces sp. JEL0829]|nr:hypothetical protein HDV03_003003 [Kappamyces sp. JEL0829]
MKEFDSTNFPIDAEGRTYHVATKKGEVASRILTVGDPARARRIATLLESQDVVLESKRAFTTITGKYKGESVSIIAIGMGTPVADMMMREVRAVTDGPLLVIRFGSCGAIGNGTPGSIAVASDGAVMISKNYDYWQDSYDFETEESTDQTSETKMIFTGFNMVSKLFHDAFRGVPYNISGVIPADHGLSARLVDCLEKELGENSVLTGIDATADSFYSSQGRLDVSFGDDNEKLIDGLRKKYPNCETLEMESGMLLHLAQACSKQSKVVKNHPGPIRATACAMVFFNRITNAMIPPDSVEELELKAGRAVLDALVATPLEEDGSQDESSQ